MSPKPLLSALLALALLPAVSGCDQIKAYIDPNRKAAEIEADGKAIGGACRHAGRAIEDCYSLNPGASKAAIFDGWKEMNDYMTQHNIATVKPELPPPGSQPKPAATSETGAEHAQESEAAAAEAEPPPTTTTRTPRTRAHN